MSCQLLIQEIIAVSKVAKSLQEAFLSGTEPLSVSP